MLFFPDTFLTQQNESSVSLREEENGLSGHLTVSTRGLHNHTGLNPCSLKALGNGLKEQKKMRARCGGEGMGQHQDSQLRGKHVPCTEMTRGQQAEDSDVQCYNLESSRDVAQWESACLVCVRPQVQSSDTARKVKIPNTQGRVVTLNAYVSA